MSLVYHLLIKPDLYHVSNFSWTFNSFSNF